MEKLKYLITTRGWLRSWQLWAIALLLAAFIWVWWPVKFGSIVLLLARFFFLAGGIYLCTRIFFPVRYHDLPKTDPLRRTRALGVYIALAGAAIGAGSGAIG